MLAVTMLFAGRGADAFILAAVRWDGMQKLLKEGGYVPKEPQEKRKLQVKGTVSTVYWMTTLAVYLGWSFWTDCMTDCCSDVCRR